MAYRLVVGAALCLLSVFPVVSQAQTIAFVDDQSAPAATLLDGSTVRVRVVDAAANSTSGRDSVSATVISDLAGDSESLSLLETGLDTGVFEGLVDLEPGASPGAPTLATATSPGPPPTRDTVHATYGSATASAGLVGSIVQFIDDWGRETASLAVGFESRLRVRDELRNSYQSRDSLTVTVTSLLAADSDSVSLQETGMNTGVFEGIFTTTRNPESGYYLAVEVPDTVTATLADADGLTTASGEAQAAGARIVLRDADGNLADTFVESSLVRILVFDFALPSSTTVQVTSALTGDSETLVIPGSFLYEGTIQTVVVAGTPPPAVPGDGALQIAAGDTMTVTYTGAGDSVTASAGFIPGRLAFLDSRGRVTASYAAGTEARLRLEHASSNTPALDRITVRLVNVTSGEEEDVELTETHRDSGVFTGSMTLTVNGSGQGFNGALNAQPDEQIRVERGDIVPATAGITDRSLEFLDEQGEPTDEIVESGTARVRMFSTFSNNSPSSADSASVEMRVRLSNDLESLVLTETGPDTNVFEGSMSLEMGSYGNPDGKLQTANSGMPDYRPDEIMARSGPVEASARTVGARIDFLDAFGRETSSYAAGETVRLRIVDHFRSAYGTSFQVSVVVLQNQDLETVTLQETAPGTGIFTGSIPTTLEGSLGDGKLLVGAGLVNNEIEVRHATGFSPIELTKRASIVGGSIVFVDAAGQPATTYLESTRAYVRVVSAFGNSSPSLAETVTVSLLAELSQDSETLTLTETGPDTSVFGGSIGLQLLFGSPAPGNGILETTETGSTGDHEFDTLRATLDIVPGQTAVARIGLTGSRTWFGNVAGGEVLSYPAGGTAYVWVEDQNRNTPGQWDTVYAELRAYPSPSSTSPDDGELLTLLETTRDSGIFRVAAPLTTGSGASGDGQVNVPAGGQIEAVHQDAYGVTASSAVAGISDLAVEFLDEAGNPTTELLEGDDARVRMFRLSPFFDPYTAETFTITLQTLRSGDVESVTLTETGPNTYVFEGSIPMQVGGGSGNDGTLSTISSGSPEYLPEEVTAYFGEPRATARVLGARVRFFDAYGRETASYAAGEPLRVRVVDHNANQPSTRDTVQVAVTSRDGGDSEPLALQETGFDTAVFEGVLPTAFGGSGNPSDNSLRVFPDDEVEASYQPSFSLNPLVAQAAITGNSVLFIDAAGSPATVYLESSRAYVRVVSAYDFNRSPTEADTISVDLLAVLTQDTETLVLGETGPDTGVFEGSIMLRLSQGVSYQGNGILETIEVTNPETHGPHEFDTLQATYADPTGTSVARIGLTGSRTWFADASGQEVLSYPAGGTAYVRVEDQNRNQPGVWDTAYVEVSAEGSGDQELMQLQETTRDSGVFVIALALSSASGWSGDGTLQVMAGNQIEAVHQDHWGATASSAVAEISDLSIEFIDEAGNTTTELLERDDARVRMFRFSPFSDPQTAETHTINLQTLRSGDVESVTLTETGPNTHTFEGSIPMQVGGGSGNDGTLSTLNSGSPEYLPEEVTAYLGDPRATARVLGARVRFFDAYGRETASYAAGEPVRVRVVDHNANQPSTQDTVQVMVTSRDGGDSESLTLQETGFDTAVFEGVLPTSFGGPNVPSDNSLGISPDDDVEARYQPSFSPNHLVAQAAITGNAVLFIDAAGQPAAVYLESSRAWVRVVSAYDIDRSPSAADTISVDLLAELSQDVETLTLTETGPNTSVFEGSIALRLAQGSTSPGNGVLETTEDGHPENDPPHEFDTLRATYADPTGTSVARIGLTGSRTWFADASGQEVLSYPAGGTAYVRVEDQNRNQPGVWDTVYVEVRSEGAGDQELVQLLETTRDSGVFVTSLTLSSTSGSSGDGTLQVMMGYPIKAVHQDAWGATSSSAVAGISDLSIEFIDETGNPTTELLEADDARVRMFRFSPFFDPSTAETFTINLQTLRSGDMESVTLTETGPNTYIFEGSISMQVGGGSGNDGTLSTLNSGSPEYLPEEVTAHYGEPRATARVLGARVRFFDAYGRETASYAAGESVRVRVVDHNANQPSTRDMVHVTVQAIVEAGDGGDTESLTLQETGFDTAVFEGVLPTTFGGSGFSFDNSLLLYPENEVEARYQPSFSPNHLVAQAAITGNAVLFIDAAGQPATVFLESSRAYVRVVSHPGNVSPSSADTISVDLLAELSQDAETLTLTETGPNTSVFEGSIALRLAQGSTSAGSGVLETTEDGHPENDPPHEFDTLRATYADPAGTSVARIGLTGSRTWFADASGQEVLSYPAGGTAYVRVEDQNRNQPGLWDTVYVEVRSEGAGDQELVQLLETTRDSGVFVIALALSSTSGASGDGTLQIMAGYPIEAIHQDAWGATASSAVADISDLSIEFIDEAGNPTTELLEGDDARVRMFRFSPFFDPSTAETFTINLQTLRSGDMEPVTLTETGPNTYIFEGSIPMQVGGGSGNDGTLSTLNSGSPEYLPEEVTAHYGEPRATARVLGAQVRFFDAYGRETTSYAAGEPVRVRVVDHNANQPSTRDMVQVTVTSRDGGDSEYLTLEETGFDTAVFEGVLPTVFGGPGAPSDNSLGVSPEDEVEARYQPSFSPNHLVAQAAITGNAVLFVDAAGQPATVYLESSRAYVRVVSHPGNVSPSSADTISVDLLAELSQDAETLTLTETGPSTSVFEGSIALRLAPGSAIPGNGTLETTEDGHPQNDPPHEFDTLRATYADPAGTSVARIGLTGSRTWFADAAGQEVLSYPAGGTAYVRVEDQNRNQPGLWDTVYVEVRSEGAGDQELVQLLETTRDSGVFVIALALSSRSGASGDGTLQIMAGYPIEAIHQDAWGATASSAVADISDLSIEFIDEAGNPTTELLEGDDARVRMFRFSPFFDPNTAETFTINLQTLRSGDVEPVTLTETGPNTHIFEGSIPMQVGGGVGNDGVLSTVNSGSPEYLPEEVTAYFGGPRATVLVLGARVRFFDAYGRETASYAAGEPVRVRVVDHNANQPSLRDMVQVMVTSRDGGDSESLTLEETGFDTAVFEGVLPTVFGGPGAPSDNSLGVSPEDEVEARYQPSFSPNHLVAQAAITGNAVLFIDAAGQPATVFLESSRAYVRVVSAYDINRSPSAADTISVDLLAELSQDTETLTLTETGPSTSVFEGSIALRLAPGSAIPGNGTLETTEDGHPENDPPHEFDTLRATYADPTGTSVARIGLTGSRTWFADAAGQEVLSYPLGGTAYVRVEDQNRNQPGVLDTVYAEVNAQGSGDQELVQLQETTPDSGVFVVALELVGTSGQSGDGTLQIMAGYPIEALHQDAWGATASTAVADTTHLGITFLDAAGEPTTELLEGGDARVRVLSINSNSNPTAAETFPVTLQTLRSGDTESVTLAETGPDTGIFEGSIPMQVGGGAGGDGVLSTLNSGSPEYLPEEVSAHAEGLQTTATVVPARVAFMNLRGQEVSAYALRSTVRVRVTDHNRNTDPGQSEILPTGIQSLVSNDSETLTLTETGPDTGVFEGSVPSTDAGTVSTDGVLVAPPGQVETAHMPAFTPIPILRQATILSALAPVATDDTATTLEDEAVVILVLANDSGASALTVAAVTQPAHGSVTINPNGTVAYTPSAGYYGPDSFTYLIVDAQGGEDVGGVAVTVKPGNQAPTPAYDNATTAEDQPVVISVLANDTDPDNDTLRVVAVTQPAAGGTVVIDPNETTTYTPAPDANGEVVFQYTVRDPGGLEGTSAVTVTITPVNDAPVANDDAVSTPEDTPVTVNAAANDSDVDSATYYPVSVTTPSHGTAEILPDHSIVYTPNPDFTGSDSFVYTLQDDAGATDVATVSITVTSENDAPVANDDTATVAEEGSVNIAVLGNDTDAENDTLDVTAVTQGANGSAVINPDETVTYTPNANFSGTDSFTYTVSDGNGGTDTAAVTVTVTGENDAPVANDDAATVAEDGSVSIAVLGNDTDTENDALQVDSVTQGDHGTVAINPDQTVSYTPAANFHGADSFTYTAGDGNGGSDTATVTVTVTPVNDAPVANADAALVAEDGTVDVPVLANDADADNDTLTVVSVTQGANGAVAINPDQTVRYTPAANYNGSDTFTYTIEDGNGGTATATVTVTIGSDNDAPVAGADNATTGEDTAVTVTVLANDSDPDNDVLDVVSVTQGTNGTVALNGDETVTYTPALNFHGTDTFTYTVSDGNGGSDTATVTITVTSVNDAPAANADTALVPEDGTVAVPVLANDADADNDALDVTAVTQGANGSVAINPDETVTYTPAPGFNGSDTFTYTVSDGNGGTATASVSVSITSVNDFPVANPDAAAVAEDGAVAIAVLTNDSDPENDVLQVASVTQGAHGSVTINPDQTVTYTPEASYNGSDAFTYTASDGNGGTATAAVTVTISAVNDAPVAVNDTASTTAEVLVDILVLSNDVDIDGPSLSIQSVTQPAHGTVSINANQTLRYTPASDYKGTDSFTYTVTDGAGGTATATVSLTVNAPPRVTTNLQVLYGFNEGSGTAVTDTSGVGTPLNLTIGSAAAVTWISGGLQVNSATLIQSAGAATKVITASQSTNAITLEAWINPLNTSQTGPIATVSQQSNKQNFSLNQSGNRWNGKLRTTSTSQAGSALSSAAGTATLNLTHVVYTRDGAGSVRVYVNGVQSASTTLSGNFLTWTATYKLGLVNELSSGSPWRGELYLVAIYNRALSSSEARQNWLAGE